MIVQVNKRNIQLAAEIHSISWKASDQEFCTRQFIDLHTVEHQEKYLHKGIDNGKQFYMLVKELILLVLVPLKSFLLKTYR